MKIYVTMNQVSKATLTHNLFSEVNFQLGERDRVAIIGPNGSGKSTFLKILAGIEQPDSGLVTRQRLLKMAFVCQDVNYTEPRTVLEEVTLAAQKAGIDHDSALIRAAVTVDKLGFENSAAVVTELSGGWKRRVQLASALVEEPDVLLLDEPTNHLDFDGVGWLEEFLNETECAWIMVTHDRYFLNRTAKKIVEINNIYMGGFFQVAGDYETYQKLKDEYIAEQINTKNSLSSKWRIEEAWLNRGPQARSTKARYRIQQSKELQQKLAEVSQRLRQGATFVKFTEHGLKSKDLIELSGVSKAYGERSIISDFSGIIRRREIIGILGGNGSGKTTLLKLLGGLIDPDSGAVRKANDLEILYFDQVREALQQNVPLGRFLTDYGDRVFYHDQSIHINSWIRRFRFTNEHLEVPVTQLSGGEKARALIAKLIQQKADLLLLDEPTNDLDITTLELLEESLLEFQGAVVIVTHDRYMLERIADYFIGITPAGKLQFYADYQQWIREVKEQAAPKIKKDAPKKERTPAPAKGKPGRLSYMEMREFDGMEERILTAEEKLAALKQEAEDPANSTNSMKLRQLCEEMEQAQAEVDKLYHRWSELEGKMAGV
jgi:ATP-binding cassette subfamily F protein uup